MTPVDTVLELAARHAREGGMPLPEMLLSEVVRLSGASGGQRSAALYFAIRYKSQPQDPEHWCGAALAVANS